MRPGRSMGRSTTRSRPEDEPPPDRSRTGCRTRRRRDRALPRAQRSERAPAHSPAVVASRLAPAPAHRRAATARRPTVRRRSNAPRPPSGGGSSPSLRWVPWIVLALIAAAFIVSSLAGSSSSKADLTYSQFVNAVDDDNVKSIDFNKSNGAISGKFVEPVDGKSEFSSSGPKDDLPDHDARQRSTKQNIDFNYVDDGSNILGDILLWVLPLRADHRLLRVDEPARAGADGRGHEHRQAAGRRSTTPRSRRRRSTTSPATARSSRRSPRSSTS